MGMRGFLRQQTFWTEKRKEDLVINYKPLNKFVVDKKYPIPLKDELIRKINLQQIWFKIKILAI